MKGATGLITLNSYLSVPLLQTLTFTVDFEPTLVGGNATTSSRMYTVFLGGVALAANGGGGSVTTWRWVCDNHFVISSVLSRDL